MEGLEITNIRKMNDEEYEAMYWTPDNLGRARALVLEDGTILFPSKDPEGNSEGFFCGIGEDEDEIIGSEIESVGEMDEEAMEKRGWPAGNPHRPAPPVLSVSSGHKIYPAADGEMNGPGALFGFDGGDLEEQIWIHFPKE